MQAKASIREASAQTKAKANAQARAGIQVELGVLAKTGMQANAKTKSLRKAMFATVLALAAALALTACTQTGDAPQPSGPDSYEGVTTVVRAELPAKPAADDYEAQDELLGANALDGSFADGLSAFSYRSAAAVLG